MFKEVRGRGSNDEVKDKVIQSMGLTNLSFLKEKEIPDLLEWLMEEKYIDYISCDINSVFEHVRMREYRKELRKIKNDIQGNKRVVLGSELKYKEHVLDGLSNVKVYCIHYDDNHLKHLKRKVKIEHSPAKKGKVRKVMDRYEKYKVDRHNEGLKRYDHTVKVYIVVERS